MNVKNVKFSVLIPAYKSTYLKECIESILAQSYSNLELIIVDDASPEDLNAIVSQYNDARIHFYRNDVGFGAYNVVGNWNKCLEYATGDYALCMGDDDMLMPCCLEEYVKLVEKYPGLGLYHAWTVIIDEHSKPYDIQDPRPEWESALSLLWNRMLYRMYQFIGDFLFDIQMLRNNGGFVKFPLAWSSDDITVVTAASQFGCANTQRLCFMYRVSRFTISNMDYNSIKIDTIRAKEDWIYSYLDKVNPSNLSDSDTIYYKLLKNRTVEFFVKRYKFYICSDLRMHPQNFFKWFHKRKRYHLSINEVIITFLRAIKSCSNERNK